MQLKVLYCADVKSFFCDSRDVMFHHGSYSNSFQNLNFMKHIHCDIDIVDLLY